MPYGGIGAAIAAGRLAEARAKAPGAVIWERKPSAGAQTNWGVAHLSRDTLELGDRVTGALKEENGDPGFVVSSEEVRREAKWRKADHVIARAIEATIAGGGFSDLMEELR